MAIGGRRKEDIEKALEGFDNEALVWDAYAAYDSYVRTKDSLVHQYCCVHLRRMLLDSISIPALNKALLETKGESDDLIAGAIDKVKEGFLKNEPAYFIGSCKRRTAEAHSGVARAQRFYHNGKYLCASG